MYLIEHEHLPSIVITVIRVIGWGDFSMICTRAGRHTLHIWIHAACLRMAKQQRTKIYSSARYLAARAWVHGMRAVVILPGTHEQQLQGALTVLLSFSRLARQPDEAMVLEHARAVIKRALNKSKICGHY